MQIKHTFLFTLILGLAWAGILFAFQNGPDPGSNGVFGDTQACATAGCHVGNPLNSTSGSLTLSGLPSEWTPSRTYTLTITVQRSSAVKFGFQLSAVSDSNNQQAGSFATTSNRVAIDRTTSIQYAQHSAIATSVAPFSGTFTVNWTAPSSASAGMIRFNLAGNAANGNVQNTGDFIFTRIDRVPVSTTVPPPDNSVRAFSISNLGGLSVSTDGSGDLSVGYSRIQPDSGRTTPNGVAIFGFRQGGTLVTEAGVPASTLLTSGRIYAEVNGPVNTGLAIANPNNQTATISFHFTNSSGADFRSDSTAIPANSQIAKFLDQDPFLGGSSVQGTFSFSSNVPVSVIALRGFTNERTPGEFLITTLPVTDLSAATTTDTAYLSHFADGGGWTTQTILVNPTDSTLTGSIQFWGQGTSTTAAVPATIISGGQSGSSFTYSIPRQSSFKLVTAGTATSTSVGSVRVVPSQSVAPSSLVVFSFKPAGVTVSEAGVPGIRGSAFRMYAEVNGTGGSAGTIQTGLAIANTAQTSGTITLELQRLDGSSTGLTPVTLVLPANGQIAKFIHEIFPMSSLLPFQGIVRISGGTSSGISVVGLRGRYNERQDFLITTTPPSNEAGTASSAELLFPHLVNGGGYTTQFILFSGVAGQTTTGNLRFFKQDGSSFSLTLN